MVVASEAGVDAIEVPSKTVQFGSNVLYLEQHRAHDPQVARAVPAGDRLILDGLGAKGTLHLQLPGLALCPDRFDFASCPAQFITDEIALAKKIVALGDEPCGNDYVARAGGANKSAGRTFGETIGTRQGLHGTTFR